MQTLMLIDDDRDDIDLFLEALGEINPALELQFFDNGPEALSEMNELRHLPRYIFLDINLPITTGWDVLKQIKENPRWQAVPVVIFTTSSNPKEKERAKVLGAAGFITKPNDFGQLKEELRRYVA